MIKITTEELDSAIERIKAISNTPEFLNYNDILNNNPKLQSMVNTSIANMAVTTVLTGKTLLPQMDELLKDFLMLGILIGIEIEQSRKFEEMFSEKE